MSVLKKITIDELLRELDKYSFKQLHIHHTWKPTHKSFNGTNHIELQQNMKNFHINSRKFQDIAQHLTLFPDGVFVTGRPFNMNPASIKGWNNKALCVEMIGNFDNDGELPFNNLGYDKLEGKQKENILKLMNWFGSKYGYDKIKFHRDNKSAGKSCPGTSLNKENMIKEAKNIFTSKEGDKMEKKTEQTVSDWAKESWDWAKKNNITDGKRPKDNMSREEMVTMLYRYEKLRK